MNYLLRSALLVVLMTTCGAWTSEIPGLDKVAKDVPKEKLDPQLADYVRALNFKPVPVPSSKDASQAQMEKIRQAQTLNSYLQNYVEQANLSQHTNVDFKAWTRMAMVNLGKNDGFLKAYKSSHGSLPPFKFVNRE